MVAIHTCLFDLGSSSDFFPFKLNSLCYEIYVKNKIIWHQIVSKEAKEDLRIWVGKQLIENLGPPRASASYAPFVAVAIR